MLHSLPQRLVRFGFIQLGTHASTLRTVRKGAAGEGAEGAQAPPLAIRILMFIFLVIHQHCKSRSGVLQDVLRQYHKA